MVLMGTHLVCTQEFGVRLPVGPLSNKGNEMTTEEELEFYRKLVKRIVVHADSFGDVHYYISQAVQENPEIREESPWFS